MSADRHANIDSREGYDYSEFDAYLDRIYDGHPDEDEQDAMDDFEDVDEALADEDDFDDEFNDEFEDSDYMDDYDGPDEAQEWHDFDPDC